MRLAERRTELRLAADAIAPALARAGVHHITSELPEGAAADVELLMTEVVSNAVRHASTSSADEIVIRLSADGLVRVEVVDAGALFEPPSLDPPHDARTSGWGLFLVDRLATTWGVEAEGGRKKVWFELDPSS
jgi:anti-sigma regulatory factor (Ser/Thr protein kinase)